MSDLQKARELIETQQRTTALPLLASYVKAHPQNVEGWFLLAVALDDATRRTQALQMALKLDPTHRGARTLFEQLGHTPPSLPPEPPPGGAFTESPFTGMGRLKPELQEAGAPESSSAEPPDDVPAWAKTEAKAKPEPTSKEPETVPFSWDRDILGKVETPPLPAEKPEPNPETPTQPLKPILERSQTSENVKTEGETVEDHIDASQPSSERKPEDLPTPDTEENSRGGCLGWVIAGLVVILVAVVALYGLNARGIIRLGPEPTFTSMAQVPATQLPTLTSPPTWTASPSPTLAPTKTPTQTPTVTITPTALLLPEVKREMEFIQTEVVELRGLDNDGNFSNELIPLLKLRMLVTDLLIGEEGLIDLEKERRVYTALGFLDPSYDLIKAAVDSAADALGGFYLPDSKNLYVVGTTFGGLERYVYAHEFMHALQDQHFNIGELGVYPACTRPQQECQAIQALVEGEASVVMDLWLFEYATEEDFQFISIYTPPSSLFNELGPPPPYFSANSQFAYGYGQEFVVALLQESGDWGLVNRAYQEQLPTTTEQILHPEKYFDREVGRNVNDPALDDALGTGMTLVERDALGEWQTYLLLSAATISDSRLDPFVAADAAAGWGGDSYQIFATEDGSQYALSAHWVWDTQRDADEFHDALFRSLAGRFAEQDIVGPGNGSCWTNNGEFSCLYQRGGDVLWLLATSLGELEAILDLFPGY